MTTSPHLQFLPTKYQSAILIFGVGLFCFASLAIAIRPVSAQTRDQIDLQSKQNTVTYLLTAPDIPRAHALRENEAASLIFDTPAGRIVYVETLFSGNAMPIIAFYRASLPNLGWKLIGDATHRLSFTRAHELLQLDITDRMAHFHITPRVPPSREQSFDE